MNEAEQLARTLAAVHDDLAAACAFDDAELMRSSVRQVVAEIEGCPSLRVMAAIGTANPHWAD